MSKQERQIQRIALIGTLVVMLVGGALSVVPMLLSFIQPAVAQPDDTVRLPSSSTATGNNVSAPRLPTIALPTLLPTIAPIATEPLVASPAARETSAALLPTAAPTRGYSAANDILVARLVAHLLCLQPGAHHDPTLDRQAVNLARQETTSLPETGAIQIYTPKGLQLLVSTSVVADLRSDEGRCGETLIFGVPPLDWLPRSADFGVGVDIRENGAVIVIATR